MLPALWFRGEGPGEIMPDSSLGIVLDVFGTLKLSMSRDRLCDALAVLLGVPAGGPWNVEVWFEDSDNTLHELQHKTRVDVLLRGRHSLIIIDGRFAETDIRSCGRLSKTGKGLVQCNGNYSVQVNPVTRKIARCAFTGQGIRYWEYIPRVFRFAASDDYAPCPFASLLYQYLRPLVMASCLGEKLGLKPVVGFACLDRPAFPAFARLGPGSDNWTSLHQFLTGAVRVEALAPDKLPRMFEAVAEESEKGMFRDLHDWLDAKVNWVQACRANARHGGRTQRRS
jgi:hypothetical protein